jgi:hypothetical protein
VEGLQAENKKKASEINRLEAVVKKTKEESQYIKINNTIQPTAQQQNGMTVEFADLNIMKYTISSLCQKV